MIEVRPLAKTDDFREAVRLQKDIWGFDEIELLPARLFMLATKIGGQALGAYHQATMVGFCVALPGVKSGVKPYLHSHMLGVLPPYRDQGVGRMLKLAQRQDALARGLDLVEWTFDPLEIKNAWFNIERLGAIVRRFVLNQYGTTTSTLHGGLPTDRCVAEWWIGAPYVEAVVSGRRPTLGTVEARITVPVEIETLKKQNLKQAREIQKAVSTQFLRCFEMNLAVIGFERSETAGVYLLGPWKSV
jgi:predicted GNAT superfamily acetyltransferase